MAVRLEPKAARLGSLERGTGIAYAYLSGGADVMKTTHP
jgi:hypothetical protein